MDKNEQQDVLKTVKALYEAENYHGVLALVKDMNLDKIKDRRTLEMIADSYDKSGLYEDAREALLIAYEKYPQSRNLAYKLTLNSIKVNNLDDAVDFYEDFCKLAPSDNNRFILKYMIGKAGGIETSELIKVLEQYNQREMDEKWLYELARLYHEEGRADECVALCDEITLWYADGEYEKAALELKFTHKALSPAQQARYEEIMSEYVNKPKEKAQQEKPAPATEADVLESDFEAEAFVNEFTAEDKKEASEPSAVREEKEVPDKGSSETEILKEAAETPGEKLTKEAEEEASKESEEELLNRKVEEESQKENKGSAQAQKVSEETVHSGEPADSLKEAAKEPEPSEENPEAFREVPEEPEAEAKEKTQAGAEEKPERKPEKRFFRFKNAAAVAAAGTAATAKTGRTAESKEQEKEEVSKEAQEEISVPEEPEKELEKSAERPAEVFSGSEKIAQAQPAQAKEEDKEKDSGQETYTIPIDKIKEVMGETAPGEDLENTRIYTRREIGLPDAGVITAETLKEGEKQKKASMRQMAQEKEVLKNAEEEEESNDDNRLVMIKLSPEASSKLGISILKQSSASGKVLKPALEGEERDSVWKKSGAYFIKEPKLKETVDTSDIPLAKEEDGQVGINLVLVDPEKSDSMDGQITLDEFYEEYAGKVEDKKAEVAAVEAERVRQIVEAVSGMEPRPLFDMDFDTPGKEEFKEEDVLGASKQEIPEPQVEDIKASELSEAGAEIEKPKEEPAEEVSEEKETEETGKEAAAAAAIGAAAAAAALKAEEVQAAEPSKEAASEIKAQAPQEAPAVNEVQKEAEAAGEVPEEKAAEEAQKAETPVKEENAQIKETSAAEEKTKEQERPEKDEAAVKEEISVSGGPAEEVPVKETEKEETSAQAKVPEEKAADEPEGSNTQKAESEETKARAEAAAGVLRDLSEAEKEDKVSSEPQAEESVIVPESKPEAEAEHEGSEAEKETEAEKEPELSPAEAAIARFEKQLSEEVAMDRQEEDVLNGFGEDLVGMVGKKDAGAEETAQGSEEKSLKETEEGPEKSKKPEPVKAEKPYVLSDEIKAELNEFLLKPGMEEAIQTACGTIVNRKRSGDSTGGNLIVTGDKMSGKTYLARTLIKASIKETKVGSGKIVKVQAEALNGKNIKAVFDKIGGRDLIIENVGYLQDKTIDDLIEVMENGKLTQMVVLEGNMLAVENILVHFPKIKDLFASRVNIEILTMTQWADIAKDYAKEKGYVIDDMATLALHARIDKINVPTAHLGLEDIHGIVDSAIAKASRRNNGKLFAAFSKKGKENIVLIESDFIE